MPATALPLQSPPLPLSLPSPPLPHTLLYPHAVSLFFLVISLTCSILSLKADRCLQHAPKQVTERYYRLATGFSPKLETLCPWNRTNDGHGSFGCTLLQRFANWNEGGGNNCYCNRLLMAAMISALDESVANLTAAFQQNHLWENHVLVFMGDNGMGDTLILSST